MWTEQIRWVTFLLSRPPSTPDLETAATLLAEARKQSSANDSTVIELEIRLASRTHSIAAQLAKYHDPLPLEQLRNAANTLGEEGDAASSRRVLEFVYTNQMKAGSLDQAAFLGLAEVKLADNDLPGAMALLRRMALISGEPFTGLDPAAALLERAQHPAEAAEFLTTLIKAEPWNQDAKRRLAQAQGGATKTPNPWDMLPADPAAREKALLAIIAADPKPIAPKLLLLHTALDAHHSALAVALKVQLLPEFLRDDGEVSEWTAKSFLPTLDKAERASLARGLADAQQRLGDLRAAFLYAYIAHYIAPSDTSLRIMNSLRAQLDNEVKNNARRPVVNDGVDQDLLVRPKVGVE